MHGGDFGLLGREPRGRAMRFRSPTTRTTQSSKGEVTYAGDLVDENPDGQLLAQCR